MFIADDDLRITLAPFGAKCMKGIIEPSKRTLRSSRARTKWEPEAINISLRWSENLSSALTVARLRSVVLPS
jgi:hypothetical protein